MLAAYDDTWFEVRELVRREVRRILAPSGLPEHLVTRTAGAGRFNRGTLCCLVADQSDDLDAVKSAAGVELLHRASVIRDDIQDHDDVRRGAPSDPALLGTSAALALADVLLSVGLTALAELGPDANHRALETFARMARGQFHDIHGGPAVRSGGRFHLAALKTGSLLGLTFWLGGRAAQRPDDDWTTLYEIGECLGVAFQLANDVNNVTRDEGRGKPAGSDLRLERHSSVRLVMHKGGGAAQLAAAVMEVRAAMQREMQRAQALVPRLSRPLPPAVYTLIFDDDAARAFVADQQSLV
jgi:geranylgeranyl pyrophosphate synthase